MRKQQNDQEREGRGVLGSVKTTFWDRLSIHALATFTGYAGRRGQTASALPWPASNVCSQSMKDKGKEKGENMK